MYKKNYAFCKISYFKDYVWMRISQLVTQWSETQRDMKLLRHSTSNKKINEFKRIMKSLRNWRH